MSKLFASCALALFAAHSVYAGEDPVVENVSVPLTSVVIIPTASGAGGGGSLPVFFTVTSTPNGPITFQLVGDSSGASSTEEE